MVDKHVKIVSPAKINLFLRVVGKRKDGYHEIESLMCPVSLCDTVSLRLGGKGVRIECQAPGVPEDETNLACQAAHLFFERLGKRAGVFIGIDKKIPAGAGLGGGSSNAAAVLVGLNQLADKPFLKQELARMGSQLGADVAFFVYGVPALATGIGEKIEPVSGLFSHHLIIVFPGFGVSTALVYKKCNLALTRCEKIHNVPDLTGDSGIVENLLCNDLETAAIAEHPEIETVGQALLKANAAGVLMSGSGSAVFGLFREKAHAEKAKDRVLDGHACWEAFVCQMLV